MHPQCMSVFVSYSLGDRKWAKELISHLEEEGVKVRDPRSKLFPGDNWSLEIGKALESSNALVLLVSPSAMKSESFRRETEYALGSKRFRDRLIPVIVKDTPKLPWILRHLNPEKGDPSRVSKRILKRLTAAASSAN
jgi:TIR domain